MTKDEVLTEALECMEAAIKSGDWKVDGACDPTMTIERIKHALEAKDEPVAFKIYKPTPPRHATPNVRDAELPWVYDQDPSSGNVASMWVAPMQTLRSKK